MTDEKKKDKYTYTITTESEYLIAIEESDENRAVLKIYEKGQLTHELIFDSPQDLSDFAVKILREEPDESPKESREEESPDLQRSSSATGDTETTG